MEKYILNYEYLKIDKEENIRNILTGEAIKNNNEIMKLLLFLKEQKSFNEITDFLAQDKSDVFKILNMLLELKFISKSELFESKSKTTFKKLNNNKRRFFDSKSIISSENKICLLGLPFDICSTGVSGTKQAPKKLRNISSGYETAILRLDGYTDYYNLSSSIFNKNIVDLGDFEYIPGESVYKYQEKLNNFLKNLRETWNPFILSIGGDHSVTYPIIKSFERKITLLKIDAHFDSYYKEPNTPINHNNFVYELKNNDLVHKIIHLGIRESDLPNNILSDKDIIITADEIGRNNWKNKILEYIKDCEVYISIDVDVIDPSLFKSTGYILPFGISLTQLQEVVLFLFTHSNVLGLDLVEYNPLLDSTNESYYLINLLKDILEIITERCSY